MVRPPIALDPLIGACPAFPELDVVPSGVFAEHASTSAPSSALEPARQRCVAFAFMTERYSMQRGIAMRGRYSAEFLRAATTWRTSTLDARSSHSFLWRLQWRNAEVEQSCSSQRRY
jgi:hypothetical protein